MTRTIVLGYDGSQCASEALETAIDLARAVPDSRILVAYGHPIRALQSHGRQTVVGYSANGVIAPPPMPGGALAYSEDWRLPLEGQPAGHRTVVDGVESDHVKRLKEDAETRIRPLLDEAAERIAAAGVTVESALLWETPANALVDAATEHDADLIVVGSHGGGALRGMLVGSTPLKLVQRRSGCPVVVVPHRH